MPYDPNFIAGHFAGQLQTASQLTATTRLVVGRIKFQHDRRAVLVSNDVVRFIQKLLQGPLNRGSDLRGDRQGYTDQVAGPRRRRGFVV